MPGLEAHAQISGAIVDQQNREDAIVDDSADQVGHSMHQRVQVEGGVQRVRQPHQEIDLQRFEADVARAGDLRAERSDAGPRAGQLDLRRPVVALEGLGRGAGGRIGLARGSHGNSSILRANPLWSVEEGGRARDVAGTAAQATRLPGSSAHAW